MRGDGEHANHDLDAFLEVRGGGLRDAHLEVEVLDVSVDLSGEVLEGILEFLEVGFNGSEPPLWNVCLLRTDLFASGAHQLESQRKMRVGPHAGRVCHDVSLALGH